MTLFTHEHKINSELKYEGRIFDLRVDTLERDGLTVVRDIIVHNGGVVIASRPAPDRVILIRQYRYTIDADLLELPAGRIELKEDPMVAARRELTEETGFEASTWRELSRFYSAPGFCDEILYLYEASDLKFVGKRLDIDEETEVLDLKVADAWRMVVEGKIQDAKTIAGLGMLMTA